MRSMRSLLPLRHGSIHRDRLEETTRGKEENGMESTVKLPQEWYEEGKECLERGERGAAQRAFEEALALDPYYPQALCGLSKVLWQEGKLREAGEAINRALEIDPDDPEVIMHCADIFIQVGRKDDAIEILRAYVGRNPWDEEVRHHMTTLEQTPPAVSPEVERLQATGDVPEGGRSAADFLVSEGEAQCERERQERAKVCFEMALEHDPHHPRAHNNLGVLLWNEGRLTEALEHFQQAFHHAPHDEDIVFNSFHALVEAGFLGEARDLMKLHIQHNPSREEAWELYDYASLLLRGMPWDGKGLGAEVGEVYRSMAKKLEKGGDLYGAAEALHRALVVDPHDAKTLRRLARLHRALNHEEEAQSLYEEALRIAPHSEKVFDEFVSYMEERGKLREALASLERLRPDEVSETWEEGVRRLREKLRE